MKEQIVSKLDEIADVLKYRAINYNMVDTGLYGYAMGTILFFCYYRKFKCCHEYDNLLEILLDKVFEKIGNGIYFPTYCTGIAGTLYGMQYIQEKKLIVIDVTEAQDCYSDYIRTRMLAEMNRGNIDFLHGATGIGIYLLKYALSKGSENTIVTYIDYLEKSGIYLDNTIKWVSNDISEANHIVNISLSHGMSSIAIFLARVFKTEIIPQRVENILNLATNYILDQEIDKEKYGCYFPFKSIESEGKNITRSRLGWCYGDLGVATALWYVGKVLVNNMLQNKAIEVLEHASTRLDLNGNNVLDACLCHGTAGIAQVFRRMYYETGKEKLLEASNYWINKTLDIAKWEDGAAGYKTWSGINKKWENEYSFLEGLPGIGLSLLAAIGNESFSEWDEILLLS